MHYLWHSWLVQNDSKCTEASFSPILTYSLYKLLRGLDCPNWWFSCRQRRRQTYKQIYFTPCACTWDKYALTVITHSSLLLLVSHRVCLGQAWAWDSEFWAEAGSRSACTLNLCQNVMPKTWTVITQYYVTVTARLGKKLHISSWSISRYLTLQW